MTKSWSEIKWIFEPEHGPHLDIYVQETTIEDWEKVIDLINDDFPVYYDIPNGVRVKRPIDKEYSKTWLTDFTDTKMNLKSAAIDIGDIEVLTHFFDEEEIEFSFSPNKINSESDLEKVLYFMKRISQTLDKQVILAQERCPNFPNIKVDANRGILIILKEKELHRLVIFLR